MYAELHLRRPIRPGRAQLHKVPPLCLKMAASFRRLATGQSFPSLSQEFRIGLSTLNKFDKQFLKWIRLTYWKEYVVGESGVGFDDFVSDCRLRLEMEEATGLTLLSECSYIASVRACFFTAPRDFPSANTS
jgi:hypothetical protein